MHLDSWDEFVPAVKSIETKRSQLADDGYSSPSNLLFRGQRDYRWNLETTLERSTRKPISLSDYYRTIAIVQSEIEAFTNARWDLPDRQILAKACNNFDTGWDALPGYEYLAYLRHHSFPSPLLDWSTSPFIAAHFAFSSSHSERVAVYAFLETTGHAKTTSSERTIIRGLGPYVRTHARHFRQKSEYTICWRFQDNEWVFASYQDTVTANHQTQDRFWKITLPIEAKTDAVTYLDQHNINEFSLFQTEEGLLQSLWTREYVIRAKNQY